MAPLSDDEIDQRLAGGEWRHEDATLVRDVQCEGFSAAMTFANRVADAANEASHHPDILIHGYKHVRLTLSTHSEGGVTDNDFALAAAIDAIKLA